MPPAYHRWLRAECIAALLTSGPSPSNRDALQRGMGAGGSTTNSKKMGNEQTKEEGKGAGQDTAKIEALKSAKASEIDPRIAKFLVARLTAPDREKSFMRIILKVGLPAAANPSLRFVVVPVRLSPAAHFAVSFSHLSLLVVGVLPRMSCLPS